MKNNFLVIDGMCCSGKSTLCNRLKFELEKEGFVCKYNHGALTYTPIGEKFKHIIQQGMEMPISTIYYLVDLIIDTKVKIEKDLYDTLVLQDRYIDSISTFIKSYGTFVGKSYDIYEPMELLIKNRILLKPDVHIFCIPQFDIIRRRIANSKKTWLHDMYRNSETFCRVVYDEIVAKAQDTKDAIIIDTDSDYEITQKINIIKQKLLINKGA